MVDQNWRNLLDDKRQKIQSLIRYAQLQQHNEADRTRYQNALGTLLVAEKETKQIIDDVKAAIADHDEKGDILKKETIAQRGVRHKSLNPDSSHNDVDKGKGKEVWDESSDEDVAEDPDLPRTPAGEEHALKKRVLHARLREYNVTLHRVKFLQVRLCAVNNNR